MRQLVLDNADGILVVEPGGLVLFANAAAASLLRPTGSALVGTDFGHPVVARGIVEIDVPETARAAEMRVSTIAWEGCPALLVSLRDITDRRSAERTRKQLAAIVKASDDAIIGVDTRGKVQSWNRGAEKLYGYRPDEILGRPISVLAAPDVADARERLLWRTIVDGRPERFETRDRRKDGTEVDVSVTDSPIQDATGRVTGLARVVRDISESKRMEGKLVFLAEHDPLTGTFNRRRLNEELAHQCSRAARYHEVSGLLVGDIDNFKYINDSLGHPAGDEVIKQVANALKGRLRETDLLARLGGDEFAILLPSIDLDNATQTAQSLCGTVAAIDTLIEGNRVRITISFGVAEINDRCASPEEALALADLAMYEAKRHGRNQVAAGSSQGERDRATDVLDLSRRLRTALREQRFELYAQPIIDLSTGAVDRYELLLRMHEDGQLVLPDAFIPTAERYGLIGDIDRWVVQHALELASESGPVGPKLSINLAGSSIGDDDLLDHIRRGVRQHHVDPARLTFEITETAAIAAIDTASAFIEELRSTGCTIALDDFGSGFGSFYYLKYLPIDYLKIDGDFIRPLPGSERDLALVRAILDVARGFRILTVAEHVGSDRAIVLMRGLGVGYGQGFHLGRPEPASLLATRL